MSEDKLDIETVDYGALAIRLAERKQELLKQKPRNESERQARQRELEKIADEKAQLAAKAKTQAVQRQKHKDSDAFRERKLEQRKKKQTVHQRRKAFLRGLSSESVSEAEGAGESKPTNKRRKASG